MDQCPQKIEFASRDGKGLIAVSGLLAVVDISDRKLVEDRLIAARDGFRLLVENSPFGVYVVDADLKIAYISAGARKVFQSVQPVVGCELGDVTTTASPLREP